MEMTSEPKPPRGRRPRTCASGGCQCLAVRGETYCRRHLARRSAAAAPVLPSLPAPAETPGPPQRLRHELARFRAHGLSFATAWPAATSRALRDEPMNTKIWWRETWTEQRAAWATSYSRAPWPANQRPALAPVGTEERDPLTHLGSVVA